MWRKRTYGKYWIRMSKLNLKLRDNIEGEKKRKDVEEVKRRIE